ncbi:MAG: glycosyltransferase [Cryobacterium sp.]|nr:glycosyltransferase [Cryobacterium sp.]MBX3089172.1 glycosyltransferase [Cryobacterium sp.]MCO5294379.1 glycosyltransferase [Homoserinimonas sp.]MCW5945050.1 glycosyltransferase [Cryobacterium sp.]
MGESNLRIAMVTMHSSPLEKPGTRDAGGMNVAVLSIARELARLGIEVDLITRSNGAASRIQIADGLVLHELRAGAYGVIPKEELYLATEEFGSAVRNLITQAGRGYDLIHSHYWLSGVATLPIAREFGIPHIQTFHTLAALKELKSAADPSLVGRRHRAELELAAASDGIVAVSLAEAGTLEGIQRSLENRIWIVPHGVDAELFNPARAESSGEVRAELGIAEAEPILLAVGRVQAHKGQDLAVRALSQLVVGSGVEATLAVVGEPTPESEGYYWDLVDLAAELDVGQKVKFVGAVSRERLADYFAVASATLLPSKSETFGLVALESAASGTPVIAFKGSGMLESVSEGESGMLVDSREPRDWAKAIAKLLGDAELAAALRKSARDFASRYSWVQAASSLSEIYSTVLSRSQAVT